MSAGRSSVACIAMLSLGLAGGCGQKGALVLPEDAKSTVPAYTPAPAPAAEASAAPAEDADRPSTRRTR